MSENVLKRIINVPANSSVNREVYEAFLIRAHKLLREMPQYFAPSEDINVLELAHLIPEIPETILAVYVGINDAVCNKGLVSPFLVRHGHNNTFAFDPQVFAGCDDVPGGTVDARKILAGFEPPNQTWHKEWTYVMIQDPARTVQSLWKEKGYIDMICAKFEDFTQLSDTARSKVCFFIDPKALEHSVNRSRPYLKDACSRGNKLESRFTIPKGLEGETKGLVPVVLERGEKLYVATTDFGPCSHAWSNIHPDNSELAVVNENSAVPLDMVIEKPPVNPKYAAGLKPAKGSADMTTDWFYRGTKICRQPILAGTFKG